MTLQDFLELKTDKKDINLDSVNGYDYDDYIGLYPEGKIYEKKYLESKVLKFYCDSDSVINVTIEAPRNLVNLAYWENWDDVLGIPVFLKDGSLCKVIKEELNEGYYLLNTSTGKMWDLESLGDSLDIESCPEFFKKGTDPYFMGVEVR